MGDKYGPINIQSGKVQKGALDDSGKTAHRDQWFDAPPDRFFVEDSWKIEMISDHGKNAYVKIVDVKRKPVKITLPSGVVIDHNFAVSLRVAAHAETGSGFTFETKTAWAEGTLIASTQEFE